MKFTKEMLTRRELKKRLHYDPDTGIFTRLTQGKNPAWHPGSVAGSTSPDGYIYIKIGQVRFAAHRLAWLYMYGKLPTKPIDHKNGNTGDNWIDNLREVTTTQNSWNSRKSSLNKSGYRGVSWHAHARKWQAQLHHKKVHYHLGYFDTPEAAAEAYEEKALELRGEHHRRQKITYHPKRTNHPGFLCSTTDRPTI